MLSRNCLAAIVVAILPAMSPAWATTMTFAFTQTFAEGTIRGVFRGEDTNNDGRLYSMSAFTAGFLGLDAGNELSFVRVTFDGFNGETITQVYDASVADIDDPANVFMAFSYNLNGGPIGDEANEGLSLSPLAPSRSYVMGALLAPLINPFPSSVALATCGTPGESCGAVLDLVPLDPFPNVELVFEAYTGSEVVTNAIPLPGAVWLLLSSLGGLAAFRRAA